MVRKKIDNRIRVLIENGVKIGNRTLFVVLGEKGRDQVVILHQMLTKSSVSSRPNVLWCYKKELGFSSHRKKRIKKVERNLKSGSVNVNEDDPFEMFIATTNIRYCYYSETHKILGNTYGMCILQDFEALTPNLLARTIETVQGGGIIVFLMLSLTSHKQLYSLAMDVHSRYRTEAHQDVIGRFNERFILSLTKCQRCIVMDDKLNVIPVLSSHILNVEPISKAKKSESDAELINLKDSLRDTQPVGVLVNCCRTVDQAKSVLKFIEAISEKTLRSTVSVTSARGRGKSAALGLSIAGAVAFGYNNIFITSPSPENLTTLFEFILKGFIALEYQEHLDYDLVKSTNVEHNKAIVRVNVFRDNHRQTIQYIHPSDCHNLVNAELVVIDEAAAIPLPLVRSLLGPYLVFLASTINGYEGTGRSLSLKLLQQLRDQTKNITLASKQNKSNKNFTARVLHEIQLNESIRYHPGDEIEKWLNSLLCLDATLIPAIQSNKCPPPEKCHLYYINRDTLFSFHPESEAFLQQLVSLYVASHYKNSPNDLQMMSDAPAHHLFCLISPNDNKSIPDIFVVIQVCFEGKLSSNNVSSGITQGKRSAGDLIPWTIVQQYNNTHFPQLSGGRIVRIATHPDYQGKGYGRRALQLLIKYYSGKIEMSDKIYNEHEIEPMVDDEDVSNLEESIIPRKSLPPLLLKVKERLPEPLHYLGVSYGLTGSLLRFWKRAGFIPVFLNHSKNNLTGEHSCIMITTLTSNNSWLKDFYIDFRRRIISLLDIHFSNFPPSLALSLITNNTINITNKDLTNYEKEDFFDIENYNENEDDISQINLSRLGKYYFLGHFGKTKLSTVQEALVVGIGLQDKKIDQLAKEFGLTTSQVIHLVNQTIRQIKEYLLTLKISNEENEDEEDILEMDNSISNMNDESGLYMKPLATSLTDELEAAAKDLKEKQMKELNKLKKSNLSQYIIKGSESEWNNTLAKAGSKSIISIKSGEKRLGDELEVDLELENPKNKKSKKEKNRKKRNK